MEAQSPKGAYIRGAIAPGNKFTPRSEILGQAIPKPEGMSRNPGLVELKSLHFHRDIEAVAPNPPDVCGEMDEENHFYPTEPYDLIRS